MRLRLQSPLMQAQSYDGFLFRKNNPDIPIVEMDNNKKRGLCKAKRIPFPQKRLTPP